MSKANRESPDDRIPNDLASLAARYRLQLEDCDLIPDELRLYPAEDVLTEVVQIVWRAKIRKRLGLDGA